MKWNSVDLSFWCESAEFGFLFFFFFLGGVSFWNKRRKGIGVEMEKEYVESVKWLTYMSGGFMRERERERERERFLWGWKRPTLTRVFSSDWLIYLLVQIFIRRRRLGKAFKLRSLPIELILVGNVNLLSLNLQLPFFFFFFNLNPTFFVLWQSIKAFCLARLL